MKFREDHGRMGRLNGEKCSLVWSLQWYVEGQSVLEEEIVAVIIADQGS